MGLFGLFLLYTPGALDGLLNPLLWSFLSISVEIWATGRQELTPSTNQRPALSPQNC